MPEKQEQESMNKGILLHCLIYNITGSFEPSSCQIVSLYAKEKKRIEMRVTSGSVDVAQVTKTFRMHQGGGVGSKRCQYSLQA